MAVLLEDFKPISQLVTKTTHIETPRFPVIDAHIHLQSPFGNNWTEQPAENLLRAMDAANVRAVVDLDGGWGEEILDAHLKHFKEKAPERFVHFGAWTGHAGQAKATASVKKPHNVFVSR
jgi:hypothetical protein